MKRSKRSEKASEKDFEDKHPGRTETEKSNEYSPESDHYQQLQENILDCIQDGICVVDADENIRFCNPTAARFFCTSPDDMTGRNVLEFFDPETAQKIVEQAEQRQRGKALTYILPVRTHQPVIWLRLSVSPRMDEQGRYIGAVGIAQDITEQKKAEEEQKKYADELKRSNEQLEQFAYIASHDLQEPLRMITSYLQLLKRRYHDKLGDDANDFIKFAVDSAERMSQLIHALLKYSRVGTRGKEPSPVNSDDILKNVLQSLNLLIEEYQADITHDPMPAVIADENQLHQLFQNLIVNAIKFHGEKTPSIHIQAKPKPVFWEFQVQDRGIGIAEEDTERIFNIFQRVGNKRDTPGAGIGLAICKRIVERHGGRIWIRPRSGGGSVFSFTLPKSSAV